MDTSGFSFSHEAKCSLGLDCPHSLYGPIMREEVSQGRSAPDWLTLSSECSIFDVVALCGALVAELL
jgi:hypothetical protein